MPRLPWIRIRNRAPAECLAKRRTHFTKHKKKKGRKGEFWIRNQNSENAAAVSCGKTILLFSFFAKFKDLFFQKICYFLCVWERAVAVHFLNCTNYYFVTKYVLPDRRHRRLKWPEQKCFATKVGGLAYNKSRSKLLQGQDISQPLTMYRERQLMSKARWSKKVNTNIYLSLNGLKWGKAINV